MSVDSHCPGDMGQCHRSKSLRISCPISSAVSRRMVNGMKVKPVLEQLRIARTALICALVINNHTFNEEQKERVVKMQEELRKLLVELR